jgi:hypothetical protein
MMKAIAVCASLASCCAVFGQVWRAETSRDLASPGGSANLWSLDENLFRKMLPEGKAHSEISIPMPGGALAQFRVRETEVLSAAMATRFPAIRTFVGENDHGQELRLTAAASGVRATVFGAGEPVLVEPTANGGGRYRSLLLRDASLARPATLRCGMRSQPAAALKNPLRPAAVDFQAFPQLRVFRMAIATTAAFTRAAGSLERVVEVSTAAMNLVNAIYERDTAVRFRVVQVIATTTPGEPLDDKDMEASIAANQKLLDQEVGSDNYDLGHVFAVGEGSGVAGGIGILCDRTKKAEGFSDFAYGDGKPEIVALDMIAHEIGHQMGAHHTFNATCGGNAFESSRAEENAVEIGSGATIMGYTGNCGNQDPPNQDLEAFGNGFLHSFSIGQVLGEVRKREGCQAPPASARANRAPQVRVGDTFVIPSRTPFFLEGETVDPDEEDKDKLTFSWEQVDVGKAPSPPNTDSGSGPLFRNYAPRKTVQRLFPSLPYVLTAANQPPLTYTIEGKEYLVGEMLPVTTRTISLRLVVRDNRKADDTVAGSLAQAETKIQVVGEAGPFRVTAPAAGVRLRPGQNFSVEWDVARTNAAPVSASLVDIRLWLGPDVPLLPLADGVPNNGSAQVTLPPDVGTANTARIVVLARDNIFFDFSDFDIQIGT